MTVLTAALWFLAGAAVEVLNTLTRKWTVERLDRRRDLAWVMGGFVLRLVVTSAVLAVGFRHRPAAGIAVLLGYLCSRWVIILWLYRRIGKQQDTEMSSQ
jgi:hypothetical protein